MKKENILVVSVMRLGDVFQHLNLVQSIQKKHGLNCQIDFLITDLAEQVRNLSEDHAIQKIRNFYVIPYSVLQRELTSRYVNVEKKILDFQKVVELISEQKYDYVYNLSNTEFSYRLMDMLVANKKIGSFFRDGVASFSSVHAKEFQRLYGEHRASYPDSLVSAIAKSLELEVPPLRPIRSRKTPIKPKILFQVTTSDSKKQLSFQKWKSIFAEIKADFQIEVLSSPSEYPKLFQEFNSEAKVISLDIKSCYHYLNQVDLVVSLDTSILHLAALNGNRCLGIFLGSGHRDLTAPYVEDAKVISANSDCYPCRHSEPCRMAFHVCEQTVSEKQIVQEIYASLRSRIDQDILDVGPNEDAKQIEI